MGKGAFIKRMVAVRNTIMEKYKHYSTITKHYNTNTIMEKKQTEGEGGRGEGLRYGIFRSKVKKLKIFLE